MSASSKHTSRRKSRRSSPARERSNDLGVYLGLLMIGGFAVLLATAAFQGAASWTHFAVGYAIAIALLVNVYAWQVYFGKSLASWQQSLAKLPLRWAGYGLNDAKPLSAARGQADARSALMLFGAGSVLLITGLTLWLIR